MFDRKQNRCANPRGHGMKTGVTALRSNLLMFFCAFVLSSAAFAAGPVANRWIGTWSAAPEAKHNSDDKLGKMDITYREIVHVSVGGPSVRVVLTNELGLEPLTISAGDIAISAGGSALEASTIRALRFAGKPSVTLPAGTMMVSDPVDLKVPALSDLAISLFIPTQTISQVSVHSYALQTNYLVAGNVAEAQIFDSPTNITSWPFIRTVEVETESAAGDAIVALGDSITDGAASKTDMNGRWPDVLARHLQSNKALATMGVLNAAINGNRILHDGDGQSALGRLDRDVLTQAGVKYLIVLEGINDIGHIVSASPSDPAETAQSLIYALDQIVIRAHTQGIKVIGATMTPFENCKYASPDGEKMRQAINDWIRTTKDLDGVADFDKIIRDPTHPTRFLPAYDSGDHLHPNSDGLKAMGDGVDLSLFVRSNPK
jgi:lysophospholipase L1-like esterase